MSSQSNPITGSVRPEADDIVALRSIVEGTARSTGDDFFRTLVRHLAAVVGVRHAFVSEFVPPQKIRTIAFWSNGQIIDNIEYDLPGTPCEEVIHGGQCPDAQQCILTRAHGFALPGLVQPLAGRPSSTLCTVTVNPEPT